MAMKLWLLLAKYDELPDDDNPWNPWFDKVFGLVVRADTEKEAREIAHENAEKENSGKFSQPWKDQKYSTCTELTGEGRRGLVLTDFHACN